MLRVSQDRRLTTPGSKEQSQLMKVYFLMVAMLLEATAHIPLRGAAADEQIANAIQPVWPWPLVLNRLTSLRLI